MRRMAAVIAACALLLALLPACGAAGVTEITPVPSLTLLPTATPAETP